MEKKRIIILTTIILIFISSILISYSYYRNKYIISFETGSEEKILMQYIEKNKKVKIPKSPRKEGYVFVEWQLDGKTFDFNHKILKDLTLTAKWLKEEYITIQYRTNSDYKIKSEKILKGSTIKELPKTSKDNYEFIGWYINDKLYDNEELYDNAVLAAKYNEIPAKIEYNVGDIITIVGSYAATSYSIDSPHSVAIGWQRTILNIIKDTNYPYVIGNEYGVTGFFREESIQKER